MRRACDVLRRTLLSTLAAFSVYCLTPYTSSAETQRTQHEAVENAGNRDRPLAYEGLILQVETYIGRHQEVNGGIRADVWPVLLLKGGQYVDPDVEVGKVGLKPFVEQWLKGRRFAVYGDGGRYGYLENLTLMENKKPGGGGGMLESSQATLVARNGGDVNLAGDHVVKRARARQFVGKPLAIDEAHGAAAEAMLAPLVNPDPPLTAELIQSFISDVNVKKLAGEFERRLLARGGVAEGATVLERKQPYSIAHLDVDGNGLPDIIGDFSLLVERNGQRFRFSQLFIRYDSGITEAIWPILSRHDRVDGNVVLISFLKGSDEEKVTNLLISITPAWSRNASYAALRRTITGWVISPSERETASGRTQKLSKGKL